MSLERIWARAIAGAALLASLLTGSAVSAEPITLAEALRRAEEQSPLLSAADAAVRAAEARARQTGVGPNPELEVEVENFLGTGPFRDASGVEVTASIGQRFERGGKRSARRRLAAADLRLANVNLIRARADIARDVRNAFAETLAADDRLALAREATGRATELARTARLLVETGRDPPLRQFRAEAALAEAQAAEQQAIGAQLVARRQLSDLIGLPEEEIEARAGSEPPAPNVDGSGQPLTLQIAEAERGAAEARIDLATSQGVPDITARAGVRGFADTDDVALVAGISLPLAIRDRNRGGIEAARADLLAAEARLAQARLDSTRELRDARTLLAAADARLGALEGPGLDQAREAVRVARIGYAAGRFSLLEVLDAEAALNTALGSIIDARRDRARALAALIRAQPQEGQAE